MNFVADVQIYTKTIIIGFFFFFSYIMGKKVKNGRYTNTVYTLILVVMREGVSRDYIYKLIIQNKYRQTRGVLKNGIIAEHLHRQRKKALVRIRNS